MGRSAWKGLVAGAVGGIVGTIVMGQFQSAWSAAAERLDPEAAKRKKRSKKEPATVKAAEAISEGVFDHELTKSEKPVAGQAVHYAMGVGSAAVYGVTAELAPIASTGVGLPFGTAVWLAADEAAVPALGLAKPPAETPLATHAYALASHLVYGLATDLARRAIRRTVLR